MAQVPMTFYLHSDKDTTMEDFKEAFPVESQNDDAMCQARSA